ncbi:SGNH/GDSL hydrolase family protein [Actinocatenispora sera]|uniref:SGNH hydrolase n=1 Tax=Actinocatenispora sera TaxID=390989 RepID=A0A810L9R1_9ACTN|nr:SGNH/GDSL hydrolase family protein [Actinocatenispora sera]BCJ31625.1 SGNH hydrolase [Actinocatenispora sera]
MRPRRWRTGIVVAALALATPLTAYAAVHHATADRGDAEQRHAAQLSVDRQAGNGEQEWRAGWRAAPQPPVASGPSHDGFTNRTVRMVVRPTVSGPAVRIRLSNRYGTAALRVGRVAVAEQDTGPIVVAATQRAATFVGAGTVTIPAGEEVVSDPVPVRARAGRHLVVSVYLTGPTGPATWHNKAQATSYVSGGGDWATEPGGSPYQAITPSWFFLDGVDVLSRPVRGTVVAFGDSITDGSFSTIDADHTYPDRLADRLARWAVLNEGIGGNAILTDTAGGGQSALHRFRHDVLDQPGVTSVVLLEGVNDIGAGATAAQLEAGMTQLVELAHAHCLRIVGGTITPFHGSVYDTPAHEQTRQAVNRWIRTSGTFDAVADFDRALRDPADPLTIDPRYHTVGDLHPNDRGYQVMANTIDRADLARQPGCRHG